MKTTSQCPLIKSSAEDIETVEKRLGIIVYEAMETYDPGDGRKWVELSGRERDFYIFCIDRVLWELKILNFALPDAGNIGGSTEKPK